MLSIVVAILSGVVVGCAVPPDRHHALGRRRDHARRRRHHRRRHHPHAAHRQDDQPGRRRGAAPHAGRRAASWRSSRCATALASVAGTRCCAAAAHADWPAPVRRRATSTARSPELKHGSTRPWESPAFLGCAYFKKRDEAGMKSKRSRKRSRSARRTTCRGPSTPGAWRRATRRPRRSRCSSARIEKLPADERLKNNLELVEDGQEDEGRALRRPLGPLRPRRQQARRPQGDARLRPAPGLPPAPAKKTLNFSCLPT